MIAAMEVTKPYDILEGWGLEEDPLVFCFSHLDPTENIILNGEQVIYHIHHHCLSLYCVNMYFLTYL